MSIGKETRQDVNRRLKRLKREYGDFSVEETTVTNEPDFFEQGRQLAEDGWIGDAGAWVTDEQDRVLLIQHRDGPTEWGTPGGGHEPGETMEETARREVREETGVECSITGVYWARRKTIVNEADPDERLYMLTVGFEAAYEGGDIEIGDDDILDAQWFSEPPADVADFLSDKVDEWDDAQ